MYRGLGGGLHHLLLKIRCFHRTSAGTGWSFYPGPSWTQRTTGKNPVPGCYDCYEFSDPLRLGSPGEMYGMNNSDGVGIGLMLV